MSTAQNTPLDAYKRLQSLNCFPPTLYIGASDEIRKKRALEYLFTKSADKQKIKPRTLNYSELDQSRLQSLLNEMVSPSLFAEPQVLVITESEELKVAIIDELKKTIPLMTHNNHLVFFGHKLPQANPLNKLLRKFDAIFELPDLKPAEFRKWIAKELGAQGVTKYPGSALDLLGQLAQGSLDRAFSLISHLATYVDGDELKEEHLKFIFSPQLEPDEFQLIDSLTQPVSGRSESLLMDLLSAGKSPFMITALTSRIYANYLLINSLLDKGLSEKEVQAKLNINPWIFKKNREGAARYSLAKLVGCQKAILKADSQLKNKSLGAEHVLGELFRKLHYVSAR